MKYLALIAVLLALNFVTSQNEYSYTGYRLLRLYPTKSEQVDLIGDWENSDNDFDVWGSIKHANQSVTVLLSSFSYIKYKHQFNLNQIKFEILEDNMQSKIDEQKRSMNVKRNNDIVGKFARYSEIMSFIQSTASSNPGLISTVVIGKTYENRDLRVLVVKTNTAQRKIWIDCGIHAREWITPATCVYMIDKLINEYKSGVPATVALLNYYEFHFLPLQNPDGYEYSWTTFRLWRKNRAKNAGSSCIGVDLNRNWGYQWMTGGSSNNPCSDGYAGSKANSELETQAIQTYINSFSNTWDSFLTLHTYGQWWFTTWGYTTALPPGYTDLVAKAKIGVEALQAVYGTRWTYGSSANILGIGSGGSEDWAQGVANIKYSYCLELRPGQTGTDSSYGFTLPEDRAPKAGEETYQGIKAFLQSIKP